MQHYEERLLAYQSVDFDDLINLPLKLLREHADVREKWQKLLGHVLVDEYQDTSSTQYELLKLLTGARAAFTCVGDDDQSIYAWRGATLDNLRRLPQDYPQLKVIKLEQNYRSVNSVLKAANSVIGSNPKLFEKTLWSDLGEGEPVRVSGCDHEEHEAERAVQHIQRLQRQGEDDFLMGRATRRPEWSDYAILYRANHLARVFEQALRKLSIPYRVSGGQSFFERTEIRDLCAWLRLLSNQDDDPAFIRAVTTPKRGIGHTSLAKLGELASSSKTSLFEALFSPLLSTVLRNRALDDLHEFGRYINELEQQARQTLGQQDALIFLQQWLKDIDYEKHLYESAEHEKQAAKRWENVLEFIDWMAKRAGGQVSDEEHDNLAAPTKSLLEVIQTVSLLSTLGEREGQRNELTLSTLHAAKGLEWPHVILAGVAEGVLPFNRESAAELSEPSEQDGQGDSAEDYANSEAGKNAAAQLEEERRLMYVGITRAQRTLLVSWPKTRKKGRDRVRNKPSRFIEEMRLEDTQPKQDPREQLKALRAQIAAKVQNRQQQEAAHQPHMPSLAPPEAEDDDAPF
jgi:ATP-dependent DNA helicase Rep